MRFSFPLCVATVIAVVVCAPGVASGQRVATASRATSVSASGDYLAWSRYDRGSRRFRLVVRAGGRTRAAPVRSRRVPFDVTLGRGRGGRTVAVYSRCRREPPLPDAALPSYGDGDGCRLYALDLALGRERRLGRAGAGLRSTFLPSIAGRRVAYAGRVGSRFGVFVENLDERPRRRTIRLGDAGDDDEPPAPRAVAYDGRRVAYLWWRPTDPCFPPDAILDGPVVDVVIATPGGSSRTIERANCPGEQVGEVDSPVLSGGRLLLRERLNTPRSGVVLARHDLTTRSKSTAALSSGAESIAVARDRFYVAQRTDPRRRLLPREIVRLHPSFAPLAGG